MFLLLLFILDLDYKFTSTVFSHFRAASSSLIIIGGSTQTTHNLILDHVLFYDNQFSQSPGCLYFNGNKVMLSCVSFQKLTGQTDSAFRIYQKKLVSGDTPQGSVFYFVSVYDVNVGNTAYHDSSFIFQYGQFFAEELNISKLDSSSYCCSMKDLQEYFCQYGNVRDCVAKSQYFLSLAQSESGTFRFFNFLNVEVLGSGNLELLNFNGITGSLWTFYACVFDGLSPNVPISRSGYMNLRFLSLLYCWIRPGYFNTDGPAGLTSYWINVAQTQPWLNTHQGFEMHLIPRTLLPNF